MKSVLLSVVLLLVTAAAWAQPGGRQLTFSGLDVFELGMGKAALEKFLNRKITLKHIGIDERYTETVQVTYKGTAYELHLMRSEDQVAILEGVSTKSPLYKTADGIGVGSDQHDIINAYEQQLLIITPESITLADVGDLRSSIVFTMKNRKVIKVTVAPTAAFRDRE